MYRPQGVYIYITVGALDSVMDALENNVPRIDGRINVWCQHIPITEVMTATVVAWQTLPKGCHECIHPANLRAGVCC